MKEDLMSQGHGQTLGDMIHLPGISIRSPFALRTGQLHFLHKLSVRLLQNDHYHLGVFVPGYGKTITALASFVIARHLKKAQRLIVFVPRGNLRDQYADAKELSQVLRNLGAPPLTFCTADSDKTFLKNASTDIIITTYQYASGKTGNAALQAFASKERCMFVFDEV
ncbi:MAG: DEAD/DEAH box helicase family protein, partial [Bacteroidota bacterium]